jgi:large subunit ribosomal protein L22
MRAELTTHNQAPRKVRLVTDLVKGKSVTEALAILSFLPKRASQPIAKLIASAAANAKNQGEDLETLRVKNITVDSAGMLVRMMPRAMGRGAPIRRRRSAVVVTLDTNAKMKTQKKTKAAATDKAPKAPVKKAEKVTA